MTYNTRDFGTIECNEDDIFTFDQPPFGFEQFKKYILLYDDEISPEIAWLQSTENENLCFILLETSAVPSINYKPVYDLPKGFGDGEVVEFGICVLAEEFQYSTINLKSPIIINMTQKRGVQVILQQDYSVRHLIMGNEVEK